MNRDTGIGTEAQRQGHRNWDMDRKRMGQEKNGTGTQTGTEGLGQKDRERGNWTGTGVGTDKQGLGRRIAKRTGTWRNRDKEEKSDRHRDVAKGTWTVDCT